jgi:hypothetical protein
LFCDLTGHAHEHGALGEILASSGMADPTGEIVNVSAQDLNSNRVRQRSQSKQLVSVSLTSGERQAFAKRAY